MNLPNKLKILFVINHGSGNSPTNWALEITNYFSQTPHNIQLLEFTKDCGVATINAKIKLFLPDRVVAVGGDGTIKLISECLLNSKIPLGILPAGSANGLAKELGISENPVKALDILLNGYSKPIDVVKINEQLCIHLSDIGLNAYAMKKFESKGLRGMWGYLMATLAVLWQNPVMEVVMLMEGKTIKIKAAMIIIANATKYGTGILVNPIGKLDDELFEVIVIKKISPLEIFKMNFLVANYDSEKTEVFQTNALSIKSRRKVHFQIDGEYLGKVNGIVANIIPNALHVIVPHTDID
jgi:diacylglycerol kinase (ATP)